MVSRIVGALIRGALIAFLVLYPGMALPIESQVAVNLFGFLAFIGGAIVWLEYAFMAPSLIEFRFCPPYNRMRYATLMLLLVVLVYLYPGPVPDTKIYSIIYGISKLSLYLWNFQYSPVPILAVALGRDNAQATVQLAHMAALSLTSMILYVAVYCAATRGFRTHLESGSFNIYLNLPTTTLSEGTLPRLQLKALAVLSIAVAVTLPLAIPTFLHMFAATFETEPLAYRPMVVWAIALWAWIPAVAFLRGVALYRIAQDA